MSNRFYRAAKRLQLKYGVRVEYAPLLFHGTYLVDSAMATNLRDAERMARKRKKELDAV